MQLRYGTNPHQAARIDAESLPGPLRVISGAPSYINLLDALNAWQLVREAAAATGSPVAASFKHVSPAGVAAAGTPDDAARLAWGAGDGLGALATAYLRARDADPKSSFGDMIAVSHPVDASLAGLVSRVIADGIVAPGFEPATAAVLAAKKRSRFLVLEADPGFDAPAWERREVFGLSLAQERDVAPLGPGLLAGTAGAALPPPVVRDALLGLITSRYTQSNSVVLVRDGVTLGIGAGQQSRVDCVRLAAAKARIWWLRRHRQVVALPAAGPAALSRQDRLNWQIRLAEAEMTAGQLAEFARLFPAAEPALAGRADWIGRLDGVTLTSDGYLPFADNIEHASRAGVRHVVEPGGSSRSDEVAAACAAHGMTLTRTGLRLFHH
jgi:phosphoribosylaminoimidazolecarboxamide formyltransferase / IMP cyclohydrolase